MGSVSHITTTSIGGNIGGKILGGGSGQLEQVSLTVLRFGGGHVVVVAPASGQNLWPTKYSRFATFHFKIANINKGHPFASHFQLNNSYSPIAVGVYNQVPSVKD